MFDSFAAWAGSHTTSSGPLPAFLEGGCCCGMPFTCIPGGWMLLWYALYLHSWRVDVVVVCPLSAFLEGGCCCVT